MINWFRQLNKKQLAVVLTMVLVMVVLVISPAVVQAQSQGPTQSGQTVDVAPKTANETNTLQNVVLGIVSNVVEWIINFLGSYILMPLINFVVKIASYNNFLDSMAVQVGWPLVRDMCNMFFVVFLLIIAYATMLKISSYHYKSTLAKLILMAILINFSKTIIGFLIDAAQVVMLTFVNAFKDAAAINITTAFGVNKILKFRQLGANEKIVPMEVAASLLLGMVLLVIACGLMLAMAAVLLYRIIALWVLTIISPLAFLFSAFPGTASYASEYWSNLTKQLTSGMTLAFFLWLALTILAGGSASTNPQAAVGTELLGGTNYSLVKNTNDTSNITGSTVDFSKGVEGPAGATEMAAWDNLYYFILAVALFMLALKYAQEAGGFAGSFAGKVAGSLSAIGSKTAGAAGLLTKQPFSYGARKYSEWAAESKKWYAINPAGIYRGFMERRKQVHHEAETASTARGKEQVERFQTGAWKNIYKKPIFLLRGGAEGIFSKEMEDAEKKKEFDNDVNKKRTDLINQEAEDQVVIKLATQLAEGSAGYSNLTQEEKNKRILSAKSKIEREISEGNHKADIDQAIQAIQGDTDKVAAYQGLAENLTKANYLDTITKHAKPKYIAIPYLDQVEEAEEAKYAKEFTVMDKETMAYQAYQMIGLTGIEAERRRRAMVRVAASKGFLDDIISSKMVSDHYGYDGAYEHGRLNHFLHSYIGFKHNGEIDEQGQRCIYDIEDVGKSVTHPEYSGHNIVDTVTGGYMPNLYRTPYLGHGHGKKWNDLDNHNLTVAEAEEFAKGKAGNRDAAIAKAMSESLKEKGRALLGSSPHVEMALGVRKGFNKFGEETTGFYALGPEEDDSYHEQMAKGILSAQDPGKITEHSQPRTHLLFMGGQASSSNIDDDGVAHIAAMDLERLANRYSTMPHSIHAHYEGAGGIKGGEVQLRMHISKDENANEVISNLVTDLNLRLGVKNPGQLINQLQNEFKSKGYLDVNEQMLADLSGTGKVWKPGQKPGGGTGSNSTGGGGTPSPAPSAPAGGGTPPPGGSAGGGHTGGGSTAGPTSGAPTQPKPSGEDPVLDMLRTINDNLKQSYGGNQNDVYRKDFTSQFQKGLRDLQKSNVGAYNDLTQHLRNNVPDEIDKMMSAKTFSKEFIKALDDYSKRES